MEFTLIDYDRWDRRDIFEFFNDSTLYLTVDFDITDFLAGLKKRGIRFYPAMIHCICRVVNNCADYRYAYDERRRVGVWDVLHPLYTVPRKNAPHLFSMVSTAYSGDFETFYGNFRADCERAENCGRLLCDESLPPNGIGITASPGVSFSSFSFGGGESKPDLTPFVVIGGYRRERERTVLPVCGEFAHAVNDGYHTRNFFDGLKSAMTDLNAGR